MSRALRNPMAAPHAFTAPSLEPLRVHVRLPGYAPTPLVASPAIADALGIGQVWVKDESSRLGLPAFKILGVTWAAYRLLTERLGSEPEPWRDVDELAGRFAGLRPLTFLAATDGNHGRAVARMARWLGFDARIFVPDHMVEARRTAIADEGATVVVVEGGYDEAVEQAAAEAGERSLVVSDTSWPGYETVPRWVIEGYTTIFAEVDEQLAAQGAAAPDLVAIQVGVGALAASAVRHFRANDDGAQLVGVEPESAACVLASVEAGRLTTLEQAGPSIIAGLVAETPSLVAWPEVSAGLDVLVAIDDERAREGMRALAAAGVVAGETGAAGLGGLLELLTGAPGEPWRAHLGVGGSSTALVISTEGATDPAAYQAVVGEPG